MIKKRWSEMTKFRKRTFALALATAVASTSFNIGSIAVNAGTSARGRVIVGFEELPEEIADQTLPIGKKKSDINFPDELEVVLYSEEDESEEPTEQPTEHVEKLNVETATESPTEPSESPSEPVTVETEEPATESAPEVSEGSGEQNNDGGEPAVSEPEETPADEGGETENGAEDESGGEEGSPEGKAPTAVMSALADGVRNTFAPLKAYAAEPDDEEENGGDTDEEASEESGEEGSSEEIKVTAVGPDEEFGMDDGDDEEDAGEVSEEASEGVSGDSTGESAESASEEGEEGSEKEDAPKVKRLPEGERRTLEDVKWKLDRDKSEYRSHFQAVRAGDVFYFVPDIKQYGLKSDVDLPEIKVTIVEEDGSVSDNSVSEDAVSENSVSENEYPEFDQFMIVDGVKVRVTAPKGVFPEDAVLKVRKIDADGANLRIEQALKEDMGLSDDAEVNGAGTEGNKDDTEDQNEDGDEEDSENSENEDGSSAPTGETLKYISFDITITDVSGNEIQPNTEYGMANVSFSQASIVSEFIADPREVTDGLLGSGKKEEEEAETEGEYGGGDDDNTAKKTLRVYHFDDGFESMEKLGAVIDGADNAVTVETGHFSPYTVALGATAETAPAGPFIIKWSGGSCSINTISRDEETLYDVIIEDEIGTDSFNIEVSKNPNWTKSIFGHKLKFTGNSTGKVNITLNGIKVDFSSDIAYHQHFHLVELSDLRKADLIFKNGTSIENGYSAWDAIHIENTETTLVLGEGTTTIKQAGTTHTAIYTNYQNLTIKAENEENSRNSKLNIITNSSNSGHALGDIQSLTLESGCVDLGGIFWREYGRHYHVVLNGGFLNTKKEMEVCKSGDTFKITGGTHFLKMLGWDWKLANVTGGNVNFNHTSSESAPWYSIGESVSNQRYWSVIDLGSANANARIYEVLVADGSQKDDKAKKETYGVKDLYTDSEGKAYIWLPADKRIYGVVTDGAGSGIYVNKYGAFTYALNSSDGASNYKYETEFTVYDPIDPDSFDVDVATMKKGVSNRLGDFISFTGNDGKKYGKGGSIPIPGPNAGKDVLINNISNQLWDIEWTLKDSEGNVPATTKISIDRNPAFDRSDGKWSSIAGSKGTGAAGLIINEYGIYTLTATVYDKIGGKWSKDFTIRYLNPVESIKLYLHTDYGDYEADEILVHAKDVYKFTVSGNGDVYMKLDDPNVSTAEYVFKVEPTDATKRAVTWSWDTKQSSAGVQITGNNTFTATIPGEYVKGLIATVKDGKYSGDVEARFNVQVLARDFAAELNKDSYQYTGEEIKPKPVVSENGIILTEGDDYILLYKNNTKVCDKGAANPPTVTVRGKGAYSGTEDIVIPFSITKLRLEDAKIILDKETYQYTGGVIKPKVKVTYEDKTLKEGVDYTITYPANAIEPGTYAVSINAVEGGGYSGTNSKSFKIAKLPTGKITIAGKEFTTLQDKNEIAAYVNTETTGKVEGKLPEGSTGTELIEYIILQDFYGTEEELKQAAPDHWTGGNTPVTSEGNNYIYAFIEDTTTGRTYISTKNIVDDRTKPTVKITKAELSGTVGNASVFGEDELSGIANYYVLALRKGSVSPNAATVSKNGIKSTSTNIKIPNLTAGQQYTFYAVAVDKAGNLSAVAQMDSTIVKGDMSAKIKVEGHSYDKIQGKQEIDDYYKEQKEIQITATAANGVGKIEYYITDKFYTSMTELENEAAPKSQKTSNTTQNSGTETNTTVNKWSTYNDKSRPYLVRNKLNYIYAKVTDKAGYTYYVSSKGIWEDEIVPKVTSTKATPKDKSSEVLVKGKDSESGVKYYYLLAKKETETAPDKADDVKSAGIRSEDGKYKIDGLTANTKYVLYSVIEDKAGNLSEIKKTKFTTKKDSSASDKAKAGGAGAGGAGGSGSGSGSGSNVDKRTAGENGSGTDGEGGVSEDAVRDGVPYIEDASDGILIGREKTSGWDRIEGEVGKAEAPAQVFVDMNGGTVVPADAFMQCQGRDVTYYFDMNDDITWVVNGLSFTEAPKNIDFRVRTDTKNIPSKLVNEIADVYPHTNLTLEHDGEFGFTAILSLNVGKDNAGLFANLYYYNEDKNSLEFVDSVEIDGSGRASFDFLHASDYTVIIRGDALTDKTASLLTDSTTTTGGKGSGSSAPVTTSKLTGHIWLIIVSIISFLLCGLILFMPDNRKRRRYIRPGI